FLRILSCFLPINTPLRKTFSFILLFFPKSGLFSISLVRIIFAFQSWSILPFLAEYFDIDFAVLINERNFPENQKRLTRQVVPFG
ncbi:MAG: hypothetical protein J5986_12780, partial [Roseburia sp.]|nr:hypothetical protein [Roseburia sp.]